MAQEYLMQQAVEAWAAESFLLMYFKVDNLKNQ